MYKLNNILLTAYGILARKAPGHNIAVSGIFDMPKRIGDTHNDWAEENGIDPYVEADDLYFGGRTITFYGYMVGDRATVEANIQLLKTAIDAYTSLVPFETPYGTACVKVVKIDTKVYNGGATLSIEFREPVVGAVCGVLVPDTTYYSAEYSENAIKNNCQSGYHGSEETLTAPAGKFTSTISQAAADLLAVQWVRDTKQLYANNTGNCIINPPVYYNAKLTDSLQKNDCGEGKAGTWVEYTVPAFKYSSLISQEDADAQAQAEMDANLTQAYANENGSCVLTFWNDEYTFYRTKDDCGPGLIGSKVYFTVPAYTFSSEISQADANLDAQAWAHMNFTQEDANAQGICELPEQSSVKNLGLSTVWQYGYVRKWEIDPVLKVGSKFIFVAYGVSVEYVVQAGDTALDVANTLIMNINNMSYGDWSAQNMFPIGDGTPKPYAELVTADPVVISVKLEKQPNFNLYVDNNV